jgi:hypothetical protein
LPNQASAAWMYVESDGFACRKDTTQMTRDSQAEKTIEMLCFVMFIC